MSKVVEEIGIGIALVATAILIPVAGVTLTPFLSAALSAAGSIGVSLVLGGIAQLLTHIPGNDIAQRQPAMPWIVVYGRARVGGSIVYMSVTGNRQFLHMVIVHAAHACHAINGYWLDGKQVYFAGGATAFTGPGTGGAPGYDDGGDHLDPAGNKYNFKGTVYIESRNGTEGTPAFSGSLAGLDTNWTSSCTLQGHCCSYVRVAYDQNLWPNGYPSVKVDIAGKSDIFDPRTSTSGYSENWALCIADVLQNQYWGLSCPSAEIDQTQLIAAANVCDESVAVAAAGGGTEPRYTVNGSFSTEMSPGQLLQSMASAAAGRLVWSGGLWKIYPAAWIGPSLSFGDNDFIGPIKWMPVRKYRDLANAIKGTFVCPTFPYQFYGPGYANNHKVSGIFDGEWTTVDIPAYAQDALHGYSSDANLAADGNIRLWLDTQLPFTISCAAAQRILKIMLLRNRQQGSGTISLPLYAVQASCLDVLQLTHARWSWSNKQVEIQNLKIQVQDGKDGAGPLAYVECDIGETDISVYSWSTSEELTIEDNPSPAYPGGGIISQAVMYPITNGNRNSAILGGVTPLSSSDAGSSATISVAAFQLQLGFGVVSYNSGSITGLSYGTQYYVYANDPTLQGGTVSYFAATTFSTVVSNQGYVYIGPIITTTAGSGPTSGTGGGGGCPCPEMYLHELAQVGELQGGEALLIRTGLERWEVGEVRSIAGRTVVLCVRIEAENGAAWEGSWDTPIHPRGLDATAAAYGNGAELLTLIDGRAEWSRVTVTELGPRECVKVDCGIAEFASGETPDKLIFTHNFTIYGK